MKNLKKGFTLIELLVVIAIIGILATTLAPKLREQLAKAKDAKALALLGVVRTAANVELVDMMVRDESGGSVTLSHAGVVSKIDKQSNKLWNPDGAINNIVIGGSRDAADGDMKYGGILQIMADGNGTEVPFTDNVDVTADDIDLVLAPLADSGEFSTEGKAWRNY